MRSPLSLPLALLAALPLELAVAQTSTVTLPEVRIEVDPGEVPGWESLAPELPPVPLPVLQPELPRLPEFDPADPRWTAPPSPVLPTQSWDRQPPIFDENGVRGQMLLGLGGPYQSVFDLQVERRGPDGSALVGIAFSGRGLDVESQLTQMRAGLGLGGAVSYPWWLSVAASRQTQPLWGQSSLGHTHVVGTESSAALTLPLGGADFPRVNLAGRFRHRTLGVDGPESHQVEGRLGLGWVTRPSPQWGLEVEADAGARNDRDWASELQTFPVASGRLDLNYLSPFWGTGLRAHVGWAQTWEAHASLDLGVYPLPWEFRLFGQYDRQPSSPPQELLSPSVSRPIREEMEAGGQVLWSSPANAGLWVQAAWKLSWVWGLSVPRWVHSTGPLGLASSTVATRDRQLSRLEVALRNEVADARAGWVFDFWSPVNGEPAHELTAALTLTVGPSQWGLDLRWAVPRDTLARLNAQVRLRPNANLELEAQVQDLMSATQGGAARKDADGFTEPGFGGYLGLRYLW